LVLVVLGWASGLGRVGLSWFVNGRVCVCVCLGLGWFGWGFVEGGLG